MLRCAAMRFDTPCPLFVGRQVLLMRAVSVSVTVLPDASPVCRDRFEVSAGVQCSV